MSFTSKKSDGDSSA